MLSFTIISLQLIGHKNLGRCDRCDKLAEGWIEGQTVLMCGELQFIISITSLDNSTTLLHNDWNVFRHFFQTADIKFTLFWQKKMNVNSNLSVES